MVVPLVLSAYNSFEWTGENGYKNNFKKLRKLISYQAIFLLNISVINLPIFFFFWKKKEKEKGFFLSKSKMLIQSTNQPVLWLEISIFDIQTADPICSIRSKYQNPIEKQILYFLTIFYYFFYRKKTIDLKNSRLSNKNGHFHIAKNI